MLDDHEIQMLNYPAPFGTTPGHNLRVYAAGYSRGEETVEAMYDGETPVVAVEVFDHPLAKHGDPDRFGMDDQGAWYVGHEVDVMAAIERDGCRDFEVQYELRPVED